MQDRASYIFGLYWLRQHKRIKTAEQQRYFEAWQKGLRPGNIEWLTMGSPFSDFVSRPLSFWKNGSDEILRYKARGFHFLLPGDPGYPRLLEHIPDPPAVLSVLGNVSALSNLCVSIVGTRDPSAGTLNWMQENLSEFFDKLQVTVVSGGARGVDQMAHRLALQAKAPTVVTLPSGLATLYPESLKEWILPICESGGAFVSEYHPRTVMRKWHFQERNRLIAGLSLWTFIVEGKLRSGTWLTAKKALSAGREIAALGASPWMTGFSGNLALLADGATMIRDAQDLVMFLSRDSRVNSIGGASLEEAPCDHH